MLMLYRCIFVYLFAMFGSIQAQVVIIAHKDVPVEQLTQPQLLDFYTGDIKRWENKDPVIVFTLKPKTAIQDSFFYLLGRTSSRMKSIWMKNMLSAESDPPESLISESAVLQRVSSTPGAIGFVSQDSINDAVKTLIINKGKPLF